MDKFDMGMVQCATPLHLIVPNHMSGVQSSWNKPQWFKAAASFKSNYDTTICNCVQLEGGLYDNTCAFAINWGEVQKHLDPKNLIKA